MPGLGFASATNAGFFAAHADATSESPSGPPVAKPELAGWSLTHLAAALWRDNAVSSDEARALALGFPGFFFAIVASSTEVPTSAPHPRPPVQGS